jgi:hypothetical protein
MRFTSLRREGLAFLLCTALAACGTEDGSPPDDARAADADRGGGDPDGAVPLADADAPVADAAAGAADASVPLPADANPGAPDAHPGVPDAHAAPPDAHVAMADAHVAPPDAHVAPPDAHVAPPDANVPPPAPDAAPPAGQCPLQVTPAAACAASYTGRVTPCSIDANGTPSQHGWMDVERPNGTHGYLCATSWNSAAGYYFAADRLHLLSASSSCCGGPTASAAPVVTHPDLGTLHGPTYVKPQESTVANNGVLRQNPFAVIITGTAAAAVYRDRLTDWNAWAGDGQAHPAPDGSGSYYFPAPLPVDYVIIPGVGGEPLIVVGPEVTIDAAYAKPLGHPTLGACAGQGGAPLAYIGGTVHGTLLTNRSGRFGHESTVTPAHLEAAKDLFNCYGITITSTEFVP